MDEVTGLEQLIKKMKSLDIVDVNTTTYAAANVSLSNGEKQTSDRLSSVLPLFHKDFVIEASNNDVHPTRYQPMFSSVLSLCPDDSFRKNDAYMPATHDVVSSKSKFKHENSEHSKGVSIMYISSAGNNKRKMEIDEKRFAYIKRPKRHCRSCKQVVYHDVRNCPMKR